MLVVTLKTTDGNITWTVLNTTYGPNDLARDPIWEDRLFAANNNEDTNNGGVLISYDGGNLWNVLPLGWTSSIAVVPK